MSIAPTNSLNISSIKSNAGTSSGSAIKKVSVGGIKQADKDQKTKASEENNSNNNESTNNTAEATVSKDTTFDRIAKDATNNRLSNFIDQMNQQGVPQNQNSAAAAPPPQQNGMDPSMLAAMMGGGKKEESSKPSSSKGSSGSSSKAVNNALGKMREENESLKKQISEKIAQIEKNKSPEAKKLDDTLKKANPDPFEKTRDNGGAQKPEQRLALNFPDDDENETQGLQS
jgi:hypothetical protein